MFPFRIFLSNITLIFYRDRYETIITKKMYMKKIDFRFVFKTNEILLMSDLMLWPIYFNIAKFFCIVKFFFFQFKNRTEDTKQSKNFGLLASDVEPQLFFSCESNDSLNYSVKIKSVTSVQIYVSLHEIVACSLRPM